MYLVPKELYSIITNSMNEHQKAKVKHLNSGALEQSEIKAVQPFETTDKNSEETEEMMKDHTTQNAEVVALEDSPSKVTLPSTASDNEDQQGETEEKPKDAEETPALFRPELFKCNQCAALFNSKSSMNEHKTKYHKKAPKVSTKKKVTSSKQTMLENLYDDDVDMAENKRKRKLNSDDLFGSEDEPERKVKVYGDKDVSRIKNLKIKNPKPQHQLGTGKFGDLEKKKTKKKLSFQKWM